MPRNSKPRKPRAAARTSDTARRKPLPPRASRDVTPARPDLRLTKRPPQFPGRQGGR